MLFSTINVEKTLLYYKGGEFSAKGPWKHKKVWHKGDYELILCVKGIIYLQVGDQKIEVNDHTVLLVPPFTTMYGYKNSQEDIDFYWMHFFSQYHEDLFESQKDKIDTNSRKHAERKIFLPLQFKLTDFEEATILVHQILSIQNELSFIEERDYLVSALMINLYKSYFNQTDSSKENSRIKFIKEWIRANMSNSLTVEQVAENVNLNVDYLTRFFKRCTGMTTLQYINHIKIEAASLLLIRTEMSIKEIAYDAYFNDPKVFMRRFKAATGLSPSEYRSTHKMIHLNNPHVDPQIPIPKRIFDSIDYIPENGNVKE